MPHGTTAADQPATRQAEDERRSRLARAAAALAVLVAVVIVAVLLFTGGGGYTVTAEFLNAGQLVNGNEVDIGGRPVGTVSDISLDDNGRALVKMELTDHTPLHEGTTAVIRVTSLSGIANRYVAIEPGPNSAAKIRDGGRIAAGQDHGAGGARPAVQHARPQDPRGAPADHQGVGSAVRRARRAGQRRAALPQPRALHVVPPHARAGHRPDGVPALRDRHLAHGGRAGRSGAPTWPP